MRLEPLGNGVEVYVTDAHHFSTDTILLAHFAAVKNGERVVELGTGCGTIPLLLIREHTPKDIIAIDIQEEAIGLLQKSIAHNLNKADYSVSPSGRSNHTIPQSPVGDSSLSQREPCARAAIIRPVLENIKNIQASLPAGETDLVICNPPYKLGGSGIQSPDAAKNIALHETECTLDDLCAAANRLLRFGGRFVICQRPERLTDVLSSLRAHDMEPKRLRFVRGRAGKAPKLFLCEAKRGAKPGYMDVLPALIIEDENGFTAEMREIYGTYKDEHC